MKYCYCAFCNLFYFPCRYEALLLEEPLSMCVYKNSVVNMYPFISINFKNRKSFVLFFAIVKC